ncbi:hypothetical protein D3C85_912870 [compost metagenome]
MAERLFAPKAMKAGAQVAPDSELPTTRRLYELTVGAAKAQSAGPWASKPAAK